MEMTRLDRMQAAVPKAQAVLNGVTTAGIGYALVRQNPNLAKLSGAAAVISGISGLATHDRLETSRAASTAQIIGGIGLMASSTPTGRARSAIIAATGSLVTFVDASTRGKAIGYNRHFINGLVIGGGVGASMAIGRSSVAGAAACMAVGMAAGAIGGRAIDVLDHGGNWPLDRSVMNPQLVRLAF